MRARSDPARGALGRHVGERAFQNVTPGRALYRDHHAWLLGWVRKRVVGCRYLAEDHAHDAFVRFITVPDVRAVPEPRAYLTTVAHALLVNHRRRRAIERAYWEALAAAPAGLAPSPEKHALILETLLEIDAALDRLPNKVRSAFLMARIEGLRYAEIGARLGMSARMMKKYMAQAMLHCLTVSN